MDHDPEIYDFLTQHFDAIMDNDLATYHATTSEELTLYEWWVTPHRIDGLPFHDFMMNENERRGTVFGSEINTENPAYVPTFRYDFANLKIQRYDNVAIASYTLLLSSGQVDGVSVQAHNESRVIAKIDNEWKVVHVHKSPAWNAPHVAS
jgi:hypothetical protein